GRDWLYQLIISGPTVAKANFQVLCRPEKPTVVGDMGERARQKGQPDLTRAGADFTFVAVPCKPIAGAVRERGSGKPLPDVEVRTPFWRYDGPQVWTKTDRDGNYKLLGLPHGTHTLMVLPPSNTPYVESETKVDASATGIGPVTHDIELERQPAVTGR